MSRAQEYQKQQKYEAALSQVERVLVRDPLNNEALTLRQNLADTIYQRRQNQMAAETKLERANTLQNADEAMIAYSGEMNYPKDWRELAQKRRQSGEPQAVDALQEQNGSARRGMETRVYDISDLAAVPTQGGMMGGMMGGGVGAGPVGSPGTGMMGGGSMALSLRSLIEQSVNPESWYDNYPDRASGQITVHPESSSTKMAVSQTPEGHEKIAKLLAELRKSGGAQGLMDRFTATSRTTPEVTAVARQKNIPLVHVTKDSDMPENSDQVMTFVIPLRNVDAQTVAQNMMSMVPEYATLEANRDGNALIITDSASNVRRVMKMTQALDTHSCLRPLRSGHGG